MKILLLGGTSYVGPDIAQQLIQARHQVTLFTRGQHTSDRVKGIPHLTGDVKSPEDLKRAAQSERWDLVIHQLAYDAADVERVLEIFPDLKRLVLTSTISVYRYAHPGTQPYQESQVSYERSPAAEDLSDPHWRYARGKWQAEGALVRQQRIPYTIVRPSFIFGPYDQPTRTPWYVERLRKNQPIHLPLLSDGLSNTIRLLFAPDAAQAVALAATHPEAAGEVFNVAQKEIVSLRDIVVAMANELKVSADLRPRRAAELSEADRGPLGYDRHWVMATDKIARLGFQPTPFRDALSATIKHLNSKG